MTSHAANKKYLGSEDASTNGTRNEYRLQMTRFGNKPLGLRNIAPYYLSLTILHAHAIAGRPYLYGELPEMKGERAMAKPRNGEYSPQHPRIRLFGPEWEYIATTQRYSTRQAATASFASQGVAKAIIAPLRKK